MHDVLEIAVPGTFALLFFGLIFGFLAWLRWMRFRETLALADRGFAPADAPNGTNCMLRWSLILMALGLALSCGILPLAFDSIHAFPALIPGLSMLFLGLAFLLYWLRPAGETSWRPAAARCRPCAWHLRRRRPRTPPTIGRRRARTPAPRDRRARRRCWGGRERRRTLAAPRLDRRSRSP
ncbi:MAG: hypothetical protein U0470_11690 [Anaerolineae bacterium]